MSTVIESSSGVAETGDAGAQGRPTTALTIGQLFQISVFWLTLNAIWGGFEIFQQERVDQLLGKDAPPAIGVMDLLAAPIAMLGMPVCGSISDYAATRWGRRKPFILLGSLTAAAAIVGMAFSSTFVLILTFFLLLQLTSNVARGPFAGLVPDLVPERQVGTASGLMGLMIMLGLVTGNLIINAGYLLGSPEHADFTVPLVAIATLVAVTGVGTFLWIPNGPAPKPREGRSWPRLALETFGTDILQERSYVFLLASRFFVLMGGGFFMNLNVLFLKGAFGFEEAADRGPWVFAGSVVGVAAAALGTIPGGKLSDRVGRKPVIYASAVLGAIGIAIIGLAPVPEVAIAGVAVLGLGSGAFLAVDWALMTDIIPKASAGRYMGISNIVEALNGAVASALGMFTLFFVGMAFGDVVGARTAMLLGVAVFAAGAAFLVPVREPQRQRPGRPLAGIPQHA